MHVPFIVVFVLRLVMCLHIDIMHPSQLRHGSKAYQAPQGMVGSARHSMVHSSHANILGSTHTLSAMCDSLVCLQNAKLSLQLEKGHVSKMDFDYTGALCGSYNDKPGFVGFMSVQNERVAVELTLMVLLVASLCKPVSPSCSNIM